MFNSYYFLKKNYKSNLNFINKRYFYNIKNAKPIKKTARLGYEKRKIDEKTKYKEKLKIIFISSIYFFLADYLYHEFILKDKSDKDKKNYLNYFYKHNIKENVNNNIGGNVSIKEKLNENNKKSRIEQKLNENNIKKSKKEIKNSNEDDNSYEIKINRITKEDEKNNYIYNDNFNKNIFTDFSLFKKNKDNDQILSKYENEDKNIFNKRENYFNDVNRYYKENSFLNGCDLFIILNGVVFLTWRISEIMKNKKLFNFMSRHFLCSYENIKKKYYHTFLTCNLSHASFTHFILNMWSYNVITKCLLSPEIKEERRTTYYIFNYKFNILEKKISDMDIMKVSILCSLFSTIPYIFLNRNKQILGSSGIIMGLIYILSTLKPNEVFISMLPLPYLKLTALQLCHVTIFTNLFFSFFRKKTLNIAWSAHLYGFIGAIIYSIYQRKKKII